MKLSVITPSFSQLEWLDLCVASVRDQVGIREKSCDQNFNELKYDGIKRSNSKSINFKKSKNGLPLRIEHIVQDAGTDGIEEFARKHGAEFFRDGSKVFEGRNSGQCNEEELIYSLKIYCEKDAGMYDAINRGLKKADGQICSYLNCDEQYLPDIISWVGNFFSSNQNLDVLFGAAIVTRSDGSYVADRRVMPPTRWHTLVSGNLSFFTSSTFFKKSSIVDKNILFDPSWRIVGDGVWALSLIESRQRMVSTHKVLSAFAETGENLSSVQSAAGNSESQRLALRAPAWIRFFRKWVVLLYRTRRAISGAYNLSPHSYSVYTMDSRDKRKKFTVEKPNFRWRLGES